MSVKMTFSRPAGMTKSQWNKVADQAVKVVKSVTPVDTGRLKSSWEETRKTSRSVTVTNDCDYAVYVNDGTPKMAPRGMTEIAQTILMEKAIDQVLKK